MILLHVLVPCHNLKIGPGVVIMKYKKPFSDIELSM